MKFSDMLNENKQIPKLNMTEKNIEDARKKYIKIKDIKKFKIGFDIEIGVEPKPSKRPRAGMFGNFYVPDAAKNKKEILGFLKRALPEDFKTIETAIILEFNFYLPVPEGFSKSDKILAELGILRPITKPDVDNLAKTTMDAMSGFIWLDDSQVITLFSKKFYSRKPRTEIKVKYQLDFLSSIFARYNLEKHKTIEKNNKIKAEKEAQKLAEKEAKKLQKKLEREKLKKEKSKGGKKNERKKI